MKTAKTIDDVRDFWDTNPLFTGESDFEPGTHEFFEQHRSVYREDCFAGEVDSAIFSIPTSSRVLDLGCGIGFWLIEFWERGFHDLTGADLSPRSLEMARRRCAAYEAKPTLQVENAENLTFSDAAFDHVNCQGVIHHTPNTEKAVSEIARVLSPGGTASLSVYYRNVLLRSWPLIHPVGRMLSRFNKGLIGRGRSKIFEVKDSDEIVRWYDGSENPIGKSYSKNGFADLLRPHFTIEKVYYHFFPMRSLSPNAPKLLRRFADRYVPFMIYMNVKKRDT